MVKWTPEQERAILFAQPRELLVSAAAGSGKTAVLTERILRRCLDDGVPLESLVVVTFTDKAALNMRRRLEEKLDERLSAASDEEETARLRQLKRELPLAQISTIHAFCLRLIREYRHRLTDENGEVRLDRRLGVISEEDLRVLREEITEDLLNRFYSGTALAAGDIPEEDMDLLGEASAPALRLLPADDRQWFADFDALSSLLSGDRSDDDFRSEIFSMLSFLRSLPDYRDYCRNALRDLCEEAADFASSATARYWIDRLGESLKTAVSALRDIEEHPYYAELFDPKAKQKERLSFQAYHPAFAENLRRMLRLYEAGDPALWDLAHEAGESLQGISYLVSNERSQEKTDFRRLYYSTLGPVMQQLNGDIGPRAAGKEYNLSDIPAPFVLSAAECETYLARTLPLLARFLEIVLLLDEELGRQKRRRKQLDFSDFEHYALELVRLPEVAEALRRRCREIMIDEYQDSSPLQEAILQAVGSDRITMLGDIKQSIYRFRHAEPRLFGGKLKRFADGTADQQARGIFLLLNRNFRSHPDLIREINSFFASFLREDSGEINYDESQALVPGREPDSYPQEHRPQKRFVVSCMTDEDLNDQAADAEGPKTAEGGEPEAAPAAASGLEELISGLPEGHSLMALSREDVSFLHILDAVYELRQEGYDFGDIAILGRTNKLCSSIFKLLDEVGIPVSIGNSRSYLDSPELRLLEMLVHCLANLAQDRPLAAVLRSPLHGRPFTEEDLFKISRLHPEEPGPEDGSSRFFYRRFLNYAERGEDEALARRCRSFLKTYNGWRRQSRYLSLSDLLKRIVESSGWLDSIAALHFGSERVEDWYNFISWAQQFERFYGSDPARFAAGIADIRAKQIQVEGFEHAPETPHTVRVMTIHASKGLEFPAVILPDAAKGGRTYRTPAFVSALSEEGLAPLAPCEGGKLKLPRLLRYEEQQRAADRAEDYRLLYVAMTRAEECLYVCAHYKGSELKGLAEEVADARQSFCRGRLEPAFLRRAKHDFSLVCDWLNVRENGAVEKALEDYETAGRGEFDTPGLHFTLRSRRGVITDLNERLAQVNGEGSVPQNPLCEADPASAGPPAPAEIPVPDADKAEPPVLIKASAGDLPLYPEGPEDEARLARLLSPELPGQDLLDVPSKLTVSELKRRGFDLSAGAAESTLMPERKNEESSGLGAPDSDRPLLPGALEEMALTLRTPQTAADGAEKQLSAGEYGTFLHRIFQQLPLGDFFTLDLKPVNERETDTAYERFIDEQLRLAAIFPEEAALAREALPLMKHFLSSELACRILRAERSGRPVWRELPFTLAVPAIGLPVDSGEISLIQGMIDLFFEEEDGCVLIDYKSDRLSYGRAARDAEIRRRYTIQMDYYAEAIRRITGKTVKERLIWLIREGRSVTI